MSLDWHAMFVPNVSPLDTFLRGSIVYLGLFVLFRLVLHRQPGAIAPSDLLLVLLVSEATQNGMASEVRAITDSFVLVLTLVFWDYLFDWLSSRVPALRPVFRPAASVLVRDGKPIRRALRAELMTIEDLESQLREQGIEHVEQVKIACIEADGEISVIKKDAEDVRKKREAGAP